MFAPLADDPRVLGIVEDAGRGPHASDLWRILRPFYELERRGYPAFSRPHTEDAINTESPQVVVLPRQVKTERKLIERFVDGCHAKGCAVVVDWDDTPTLHQRAYTATDWVEVQAGAWDWLALADAVTFTTPYLRDLWAKACQRAYWLPNLISPELWANRPKVKRTNALTIGLQGGDSHEKDWAVCAWLWRALAKRYPNLHFVTVGYNPPYLADAVPSQRFHHLAWAGPWQHPLSLQWIDIGLAPLETNEWNRAKSPIKWMEYTLAGAACVLSPTMYSDWISPDLALYAETPDQWLEACCGLIEDAKKRRYLNERSRAEIAQWHVHSDETCRTWMNVYRTVHQEVFGNVVHPGHELERSTDGSYPRSANQRTEGLVILAATHEGLPAKRQ